LLLASSGNPIDTLLQVELRPRLNAISPSRGTPPANFEDFKSSLLLMVFGLFRESGLFFLILAFPFSLGPFVFSKGKPIRASERFSPPLFGDVEYYFIAAF